MTLAPPDVLASLTCSSTKHPGVARFEARDGEWSLMGASRQRPGSVLPPSPGSDLNGSITIDGAYRGCPSCQADNIVRCGQCRKLSCWDSSWDIFTCPNCSNSGKITGTIKQISTLGGG